MFANCFQLPLEFFDLILAHKNLRNDTINGGCRSFHLLPLYSVYIPNKMYFVCQTLTRRGMHDNLLSINYADDSSTCPQGQNKDAIQTKSRGFAARV